MKSLLITLLLVFVVFVGEVSISASPAETTQEQLVNRYTFIIKKLNHRVQFQEAEEIAKAVVNAVTDTGLDGSLLIALMKTESNFQRYAISPKNYQGLMQTPGHSGYPDIDVLWGARILQKKLEIAKQDLPKALALYKGGDNKMARQQAREVIRLWKRLGLELVGM